MSKRGFSIPLVLLFLSFLGTFLMAKTEILLGLSGKVRQLEIVQAQLDVEKAFKNAIWAFCGENLKKTFDFSTFTEDFQKQLEWALPPHTEILSVSVSGLKKAQNVGAIPYFAIDAKGDDFEAKFEFKYTFGNLISHTLNGTCRIRKFPISAFQWVVPHTFSEKHVAYDVKTDETCLFNGFHSLSDGKISASKYLSKYWKGETKSGHLWANYRYSFGFGNDVYNLLQPQHLKGFSKVAYDGSKAKKLPLGVTLAEEFEGIPDCLVIDLATLAKGSKLYVHCTTRSALDKGIWVIGDTRKLSTQCMIFTNGRIRLVGNSQNAVTLGNTSGLWTIANNSAQTSWVGVFLSPSRFTTFNSRFPKTHFTLKGTLVTGEKLSGNLKEFFIQKTESNFIFPELGIPLFVETEEVKNV